MNKIKGLVILAILFFVSGFCEIDTNIIVNKDGEVDFELNYGVLDFKEELDSNLNDNGFFYIDCNYTKEILENLDFKVSNYSKNLFSGCKIKKTYNSIDEISSQEEISVNLNKYLNINNKNDINDQFLFQKKGNNYLANYTLNTIFIHDFSEYEDYFNLKYTVRLPYKSISSNADQVLDDGKTLIWNIKPTEEVTITYEFNLDKKEDYKGIIIFGSIFLVLVLSSIILLVNRKKRL